jgi:RHS repeat-associated protein
VEDARSLDTGERVVSESAYLVNDARGSVLATTAFDSDTAIAREAEYDAWGKKLASYTTLSSPRHGFAGAEADAAIGTYSFGARTYDPTLRRWISPDPLLAALPGFDEHVGDDLNLYAYAGGNPVKRLDLNGYWGESIGDAIRNSRVGAGAAGFALGVVQGLAPGGVLLPNPKAFSEGPHAAVFQHWQGGGQILGGLGSIGRGVCAGGGAAAVSSTGHVEGGALVGAFAAASVANGVAAISLGQKNASAAAARGDGPASTRPSPAAAETPTLFSVRVRDELLLGIDHQTKVGQVVQDIKNRGLEPRQEHQVKTPGATKGARYVDVVARDANGKVVEMHQVGKQTKGGLPVSRERQAMDDIQKATGTRPTFHPYNNKK